MTTKTVSHFQVFDRIGAGGMGVVYLAEDTRLERRVALKFLPLQLCANKRARQRFIREAKAASALNHPNICTVHEIGEDDDGQTFIAMAHYEGRTLKQVLETGPLPIEEALDIARQVATGLACAHRKGIVHRDIKPANIMVTDDGLAVVLDFGVAKLADSVELTKTGSTVGTAQYMSPEQIRAEPVDQRTDIWSLGAVLYEMLTGQRPYEGDYAQQLVYKILNEEPQPPRSLRPSVPEDVGGIVTRLLEKDRDTRYQLFEDVLADLATHDKIAIRSNAMPGEADDTATPAQRPRIKRITVSIAAVFAAFVSIFVMFLLFKPGRAAVSPRPVVVMPFENQTGEDEYDYLNGAISNLLITNLERSEFLRPLTWERMEDLLRAMGKTDAQVAEIDQETGFELCRQNRVVAIVLGSFTRAGDVFALDAKILDVDSKQLLTAATASGDGVASILQHQIDEISRAISGALEIPEPGIMGDVGVADVTTTSMDAYKLYLQAKSSYERFDFVGAAAQLEQATLLDSTFSSAFWVLASSYHTLGNSMAADEASKRAMRHVDFATEKEALYIKSYHARVVERDPEEALLLTEELAQKYPNEKRAHRLLGDAYRLAGKLEEAVDAFTKTLELDPSWGTVYNQLGYTYARLGHYDKAHRAIEQYVAVAQPGPNPLDSMGEVLLISGRLDEAIGALEQATDSYPDWYGVSDVTLSYAYALREKYELALARFDKLDSLFKQNFKADEHASLLVWTNREHGRLLHHLGRYAEALKLFRKQAAMARRAGGPLGEAQAHERLAFTYAARQEFDRARTELQNAKNIRLDYRSEDSLKWQIAHSCAQGFFDVQEGKLAGARHNRDAALKGLRTTHEEIYSYWAAILDGEILLAEGLPRQAISRFRAAEPPNPYFVNWWSRPDYALPIMRDGLARAFAAVDEIENAVREYERLTNFDGDGRERYLIEPKYHYRLGLLYEKIGRHTPAAQRFERFIKFWKDADPERQSNVERARARLESTPEHAASETAFSP